jgi:hypothetical protein
MTEPSETFLPLMQFPTGFAVVFDAQEFRPGEVAPYRTADGEDSHIITWQTDCPRCGETFSFTRGRKLHIRNVVRFCPAHRARGQTVRAMRRELARKVGGEP